MAAYQPVLGILGPTGVILPLVDLDTGGFTTPIFTTVGGQQFTFTWSEPPSSFDTPPSVQGSVPAVTFNGVDEYAQTPDDDYWTRGDSSADQPFSIGAWVYADAVNGIPHDIFNKWRSDGTAAEWDFALTGLNKLALLMWDQSAGVFASRWADATFPSGTWTFVVGTYDGRGGATAGDGMTLYENGVAMASTAKNKAGYVAMENTANPVGLGARIGPGQFWDGKMAGGPCGPFFTLKELSATEVAQLHAYCKAQMGLP